MKKTRLIGLDVLRILSMCGIVGLHIINQGGVIGHASIGTFKYYVVLFSLILFYTSVDVFGLLSGYLGIDKEKNRNGRIVELIFIVIFYCLLIPILYYSFNCNDFLIGNYKEIIFNFFPIINGRYWYITCYVFLFLLIPSINKFCKSIDKKSFKSMLILLFVLLTIIPCFLGGYDLFRILDGYSPFWLMYCYMIGAYIKIYNIDYNNGKLIKYSLISILVSFTLNGIIRNITFSIFGKVVGGSLFIDYVSPFTLLLSIILILLFKKMIIKSKSIIKIIVYLSGMSFSVYVIHCHRILFDYFIKDLFVPLLNYNFIVLLLGIFGTIVVVYLVCCLIDEIRKLLFKLFRVNNLINLIGKKLDQILN